MGKYSKEFESKARIHGQEIGNFAPFSLRTRKGEAAAKARGQIRLRELNLVPLT
jgi:hypothetical protein